MGGRGQTELCNVLLNLKQAKKVFKTLKIIILWQQHKERKQRLKQH
jgi:hypothetical protein